MGASGWHSGAESEAGSGPNGSSNPLGDATFSRPLNHLRRFDVTNLRPTAGVSSPMGADVPCRIAIPVSRLVGDR